MFRHQNVKSIVMVGAVACQVVEEQYVQGLLQEAKQDIGSSGEFMGKPSTYLCANAQWVMKLNFSMALGQKNAQQWVEQRLKIEREMGLYHPQRSWFLLEKEEDAWCVGNITPRMRPLNLMIDEVESSQALLFMQQVVTDYIAYAASAERRLDEGLSNFGYIDGKVYYLDDDIYLWDQFGAFSALMSNWIRQYAPKWLDADLAYRLGKHIKEALDQHFGPKGGVDAPLTIVEHLRMMFFADQVRPVLDGMVKGLRYQKGAQATLQRRKRLDLENFADYFSQDQPIALIGDVHANLPALDAVLDKIQSLGMVRILDLGDIVGYGPFPVECIQRLREVGVVHIRGNHDHMIGHGVVSEAANAVSTWTAVWNMDQLNAELNAWLCALPLRMLAKPWMAVHGSPQDKTYFNAYVYERTAAKNLAWMQDNGYRFCVHGHSHIPAVFALKNNKIVTIQNPHEVDLNEFDAALICPGSVGQPRGGMTGTQFATLDPKALQLTFYHMDYDLETTVQEMIMHQFPEKSISRLRKGV